MIFLSLSLQRAAGIQSAQLLAFVSIRAASLQMLKKGVLKHHAASVARKAEGCVTNIFIYSSISEAN